MNDRTEVDEAYGRVMSTVDELRSFGLRTVVKPSRSCCNPEIVEKYKGPDRLTPNKWVHVSFFPDTDEQRTAIAEAARSLGWSGIFFDVGGCAGQRDWELDWSFHCTGIPDGEKERDREDLESIIKDVLETEEST